MAIMLEGGDWERTIHELLSFLTLPEYKAIQNKCNHVQLVIEAFSSAAWKLAQLFAVNGGESLLIFPPHRCSLFSMCRVVSWMTPADLV